MLNALKKPAKVSPAVPPIGTENGVLVAVMGATGTGKSTFIELLTNDPKIVIGHKPDSETIDINTAFYVDPQTKLTVTLVDTPGFDDSREGVGDVDILKKIVDFLGGDGGRKLNGIIYMHRISDPRLGGMSRRNLRMFEKLCGKDKMSNVRIVTTNWVRVSEEEGRDREKDLACGAFKPLIDAGALLVRQKDLKSAQSIMSQLIPKVAVRTQIQDELDAGATLVATGAGAVINEELKELMTKHKEELSELKKELEDAAREKDEALKAELAEERKELEKKMARAEADRERLEKMVLEERQRFDVGMKKAEQDRVNIERGNAELQERLQEVQQKNEAELAEMREAAKKIADQIKTAEEERARLAEELEVARKKAELERAELERKSSEERQKHEHHIDELRQKVDDGIKSATRDRSTIWDNMKKVEVEEWAATTEHSAFIFILNLEKEHQQRLKKADDALQAMKKKAAEAERKAEEAAKKLKDAETQLNSTADYCSICGGPCRWK